MNHSPSRAVAISYAAFIAALVLVGTLHLGAVLVTVLFAYFALSKLDFCRPRWIALVLFVALLIVIFCGFVFFLRQAFDAFPKIISTSIPIIVRFADSRGIDLPFNDVESLKDLAMETVKQTLGYLGNFAKIATVEFVLLVVGVVIAIGIFINTEADEPANTPQNLYTFYYGQITSRFRAFYESFERVMSAQLIISGINTVATSIFVLGSGLPYAAVIIPLTFVCGLLPIVGNLVSNTLIVGVAFEKSPEMAGAAFIFLLVIHKLEYFLNSKIVGSRIRHPMWLTLIGLILGERLMGLPGLVLAPVALCFLKAEGSRFPVSTDALLMPRPVPVESIK